MSKLRYTKGFRLYEFSKELCLTEFFMLVWQLLHLSIGEVLADKKPYFDEIFSAVARDSREFW